MSSSAIETVAEALGPVIAPPVGLDSCTKKSSDDSLLVSLVMGISTTFHSASPSVHETVSGSPAKSSPAVAVSEVSVTVTETAPLWE